jgi:chitinase
MSNPYRATFINNLLNLMRDYGYDGIDLDMEDMHSSDEAIYQTFVTELRDSINAYDPTKWLSCAVGWEPQIFAGIWEKFDVINLMTYDMSGAWQGWVTWHNAPTYNGGLRFPSNNKLMPNATSANEYSMNVDTMIAMGVPYNKLTIGLDFYGYIWRGGTGMPDGGATGPFQEWSTPPSVEANVSYYDIMNDWYTAPRRNWDTTAGAVYLSIDNTGSSNDRFISYDDEETAATKIAYIKSVGLKGLCIWELGGGWRQSVWPSDALLQSVGDAMWP